MIPVLLLSNTGLVKTQKFAEPTYVGDPINAIRIFNEKEVDELIFLDINCTVQGKSPNFELIRNIASECFMPLCYGGGLRTLDDIARVIELGVEKIAINAAALEVPGLVEKVAARFGSQSVVVSIDARRVGSRYEVVTRNAKQASGVQALEHAKRMVEAGAGELLVTSVERDGTRSGYDTDLIREVASAVTVPLIACGGAGTLADLASAVNVGRASAVAAGSMFVFHGKRRAVLLSYPAPAVLKQLFAK